MTSLIMLMCDSTPELHGFTQNALYSLNETYDGEFIIVDNASEFGGGLARSLCDIYIRNKENKGYPASVNEGIAVSKGEFIAIANNDIRVSSNWNEVATEIFKNKTVGSVHFRMIGYDDSLTLGNKIWMTGRERWCSSSFFVIRKEAFPGYDEGYEEGGYDDWDLWHRVRHLNKWKTVYTTKACYQHANFMTYKTLDDGKSRADRDYKNKERFKKKFGDYAENIWNKKYPDQMKENYYEFFTKV